MNVDEAWERFEANRDEQFKRSSALGTMDVMQAQLNKLTADTEEIKQKIEGLAAENEQTPAPSPDMGGAPGAEGAEMKQGDQTMDETGTPGETGQDMMPPSQPPADTGGQANGGGIPEMSDEDLDLLFGGGEKTNESEEGGEEPREEQQDATLAALQKAISEATDPKVIGDLAKMIVEYTGGGDSEGAGTALPDDTPLSDVTEEQLTEEILKSESFEKGSAVGGVAPSAPKPQVAETAKLADDSAKKDGVPSGDTAVKTENSNKGGFNAGEGEGPIAAGDPGAGSAPVNLSDSEEEDKKEDEEEEEDKKEEPDDEKKDEPEESESEDSDEADKEPEAVEVEETAMEVEPETYGDDSISIDQLLDMPFRDIVEMVKDDVEEPKKDANVFINDEGEKSIPFKNCDIKKSSIDDLMRERESTMVGADGKKYQFSKSADNARAIHKLNSMLHDADKIKSMKTGEVLSSLRFMKSIGVNDVEANNMDALDVIVRGFDSKIGNAGTDAFMKSAGMDLDAIYKSTEIKKSAPTEGGKHIKTLAETGGTDIKKSLDTAADVPRAADAGKAYVSAKDMKSRLGSIDDLIAGRMKG